MGQPGVRAVELIDSGLQTGEEDYRIHVAPATRCLLCFPRLTALRVTQDGLASGKYKLVGANQPGVIGETSSGVAVPIKDIPDLHEIYFWPYPPWWLAFKRDMSTSEKGKLAEQVVLQWLNLRGFQFPRRREITINTDRASQLKGVHIVIPPILLQVKCDYDAGLAAFPQRAGTGNVFLQFKELNLLKRY